MKRRSFLQCGLAATLSAPLLAAVRQERLDEAAKLLAQAVDRSQVKSASLCVIQRDVSFRRHFGAAANADAMFLLGSISKPICVAALMTLHDRGDFQLDDRLSKFLPEFRGDQRDRVTIRHLLTHVSGLPDQVAENNSLRKGHAELKAFVEHAVREPLQFEPGTKYQYSSMGILLATQVAERITGVEIREFVDRAVFQPLKMKRSAQGLGRFRLDDFEKCQTEFGAPEAGAGDPQARDWDWNSAYWRKLGAPWGGTHASAPDVAALLRDFLNQGGVLMKPKTAQLMITNRNEKSLTPRGIGFNVGAGAGSRGCSEKTFGHTGSTGTLAWADPATQTICVVLTSLPGRAVQPHPRELAAASVAAAVQ